MFKPILLLIFLLAGTSLYSCSPSSIIILKKEVEYQTPGRKEGTKAAHYKIQFIAKSNSIDWTVQKIMVDGIELDYTFYDNVGNKQDAFNANDTVYIGFSRLSNNLQKNELPNTTISLYYFKKDKVKSINISDFTLKQTPINQ